MIDPTGIAETGMVKREAVPILSGTLKFKGPDVKEAVVLPATVFCIHICCTWPKHIVADVGLTITC
jgi:hypothetical protein